MGGGGETKSLVSNPYTINELEDDVTVSGSLEQDLITFTFTTEDPQRGYFLDENDNQVNQITTSVVKENGFAYPTTTPEPVTIGRYRFDHWSDPSGAEFTTEELSNTGYITDTIFTAHFRYVSGGMLK